MFAYIKSSIMSTTHIAAISYFFFVYVANSLPLSNASIFNKIVGTFALRLVGVFAMCDIA